MHTSLHTHTPTYMLIEAYTFMCAPTASHSECRDPPLSTTHGRLPNSGEGAGG